MNLWPVEHFFLTIWPDQHLVVNLHCLTDIHVYYENGQNNFLVLLIWCILLGDYPAWNPYLILFLLYKESQFIQRKSIRH